MNTTCAKCDRDYSLRDGWEPSEYCDACVHDVLDETEAKLSASEAARHDAEHLLDVERHYHEETKGYRQHAEELLSAAEAEVARLTAELISWKEGAEMACEEPAPRCQCAGCCLAREKAEADR